MYHKKLSMNLMNNKMINQILINKTTEQMMMLILTLID